MLKTFLGKPIPTSQHAGQRLPKRRRSSWVLFFLAPTVLFGAATWAMQQYVDHTQTPTQVVSQQPDINKSILANFETAVAADGRILADNPTTVSCAFPEQRDTHGCYIQDSTTLGLKVITRCDPSWKINADKTACIADNNAPITNSSTTVKIADPCSYAHLANTNFKPTQIFPILTSGVLDYSKNADGSPKCSPPYWGLDIYKVLAYKVLGLLNYIAFTLAVLITIYAGILYIGGFMNEANIKKAKTILIACYVGLIIVLAGRFILYGTVQAIKNCPIDPDTLNPGNTIVDANSNCK